MPLVQNMRSFVGYIEYSGNWLVRDKRWQASEIKGIEEKKEKKGGKKVKEREREM